MLECIYYDTLKTYESPCARFVPHGPSRKKTKKTTPTVSPEIPSSALRNHKYPLDALPSSKSDIVLNHKMRTKYCDGLEKALLAGKTLRAAALDEDGTHWHYGKTRLENGYLNFVETFRENDNTSEESLEKFPGCIPQRRCLPNKRIFTKPHCAPANQIETLYKNFCLDEREKKNSSDHKEKRTKLKKYSLDVKDNRVLLNKPLCLDENKSTTTFKIPCLVEKDGKSMIPNAGTVEKLKASIELNEAKFNLILSKITPRKRYLKHKLPNRVSVSEPKIYKYSWQSKNKT